MSLLFHNKSRNKKKANNQESSPNNIRVHSSKSRDTFDRCDLLFQLFILVLEVRVLFDDILYYAAPFFIVAG